MTLSDRAAVSYEGISRDGIVRIEHDCGPLEPGRDLRKQLKPLTTQRGFVGGEAGDVPTRAVQPLDDPADDGVAPARKDDRDRPRLPLEGNGRRASAATIMSGCSPTNSCASARIRLSSAPPQRGSIRTLLRSVQPKPASACVNAG